jgi:AraC-like DNA-binding protein
MLNKSNFQNIGSVVGYPFNIYYNHSPETFPLHWHNYVEVILSYQEFVQYEINGHLYTLAPNDILFVWSGELHALIHQPQPCNVLLLQFDYSIIGDRIEFRDKLCLFHQMHIIKSKENPVLTAALGEKINAIKELYFDSDNFKEIKMCIELYRLFMILGNDLLTASFSLLSEKESKRSQITERMVSTCSYLSGNCTENISIGVAAKYAGFSKSHFSRLFKEFTTDSFTSFITKERLHKVEELLTNSNLSITEAAFQAGFNSISTFNRIFKQYKHCSPTEFRDLYRVSHTI